MYRGIAASAILCVGCSLAAYSQSKSHEEARVDSMVSTVRVVDLERGGMKHLGSPTSAQGAPSSLEQGSAKELGTGNGTEIDSLRNVVLEYYYDQFRHSQDPDAPAFLFMSKSADVLMGIGGVVRMRGWYDWGGAMPANGFVPYLIPIPENRAEMRHLGTTPSGTALFFNLMGRSRWGNYRVYIEANFNGYKGRDFHLKKAYATLADWTVGYASSTFSDPAAVAPTVDAQGATNKISHTTVLVRWMPRLSRHITAALSVESPATQVDVTDPLVASSTLWLPDAAAFLQYEWSKGSHLRLAGIVRQLTYRNLAENRNVALPGWGLQLSSVAHPFLRQLTTYATFNIGHGYAGLLNDMTPGSYDLIPDPTRPGTLYAPRALGYSLGLQYNFSTRLYSSLSFSQTHYLPRYPVSPTEYRYGWCADINLFYHPTPRIQLGTEFDLGLRSNASSAHALARRIGAMCQFSF